MFSPARGHRNEAHSERHFWPVYYSEGAVDSVCATSKQLGWDGSWELWPCGEKGRQGRRDAVEQYGLSI